jgi:DNA-directed RNA polymerase subunit F
MKPKILSEEPMTMAEVKAELSRNKKQGDLNFRANKTDEYMGQFVSLSLKDSEELKKKIEKLGIPRLKPEHVTKIVDVLPATPEDLKSLLSGYTITINTENAGKIANAVKGFIK